MATFGHKDAFPCSSVGRWDLGERRSVLWVRLPLLLALQCARLGVQSPDFHVERTGQRSASCDEYKTNVRAWTVNYPSGI